MRGRAQRKHQRKRRRVKLATLSADVLETELGRLPAGTDITFVFNHDPNDECGIGDHHEVIHFHGFYPELDEFGRTVGFRIEFVPPRLGSTPHQR